MSSTKDSSQCECCQFLIKKNRRKLAQLQIQKYPAMAPILDKPSDPVADNLICCWGERVGNRTGITTVGMTTDEWCPLF